ncbi:hypothetical protein RYB01_27640, partial [Pseudomonas syringae]|nr:hypothetical protein [Pseudomonas syringae]
TGLRDACNAMWIADCGPVRAGNNPLAASTAWRKQEGFVIPDRVSEERAERAGNPCLNDDASARRKMWIGCVEEDASSKKERCPFNPLPKTAREIARGFAHTFGACTTIGASPSREPGAHRVSGRAPVPDWQRYGGVVW